jgi:thiol-disulfide isomerase/thioredoxin
MRYLLALLCFTATAHGQLIGTGIPQEPTIYVVTAPWCAPCQRFQSDWDNVPGLAELIGTQYAVKRCNWDRASDQAWARRRGVTQIPTFLVCYRGEIVERWSGYNGNWREVLQRVGLDDYVNEDGSIGPRKPAPAQPRQEPTPTPSPPIDLKPINDRLGNLEGLIRNLSQSREIPRQEASPFADPAPAPKQPTPQPTAAAKQEVEPGGLASSWGSVLSVLGEVALTAAAPHVALPAGALGVAGFFLRAWRRASGASTSEPRQIVRQQTVREVPVVVATDTPPQPARVVETNHFVPIEKDTHAKAWAWASVQYAKKYPGSENMVAALDHLMGQYRDGQAGD